VLGTGLGLGAGVLILLAELPQADGRTSAQTSASDSGSVAGRILTLIGLVLAVLPFFGLLFCLIPFALNRKVSGWPRWLSSASLGLAFFVSLSWVALIVIQRQ
jgi:hypothetical protein